MDAQFKTPIYTRKAIAEYHNRNKDNPEYIQKRKEYQKKYYEKNKEIKVINNDILAQLVKS